MPAELRGKRERLARLEQAKGRLALAAAADRVEQEQKLSGGKEEQRGKRNLVANLPIPDAVVNHDRKANTTDTREPDYENPSGRVPGYDAKQS